MAYGPRSSSTAPRGPPPARRRDGTRAAGTWPPRASARRAAQRDPRPRSKGPRRTRCGSGVRLTTHSSRRPSLSQARGREPGGIGGRRRHERARRLAHRRRRARDSRIDEPDSRLRLARPAPGIDTTRVRPARSTSAIASGSGREMSRRSPLSRPRTGARAGADRPARACRRGARGRRARQRDGTDRDRQPGIQAGGSRDCHGLDRQRLEHGLVVAEVELRGDREREQVEIGRPPGCD